MNWREAAQQRWDDPDYHETKVREVDARRALALLAEAEDIAAGLAECDEPFVQAPGLVFRARAFLAALRTEAGA